jgi:glycosyltransferase involved in cell wall biosynthesis
MNVNLIAPINSLGYGVSGQNISHALTQAGATVSLFPIGPIEVEEGRKTLIEELKANASEFDTNAPCLRIWHQNDLAEFVGRGLHIGFPIFELDKFNAREKHHLNSVDRIFVASEWAKGVVEDNLGRGDETYVVPLGVNREIFHENVGADRLDPDFTTFLSVGKWETRKGHDVLIDAFCKAFKPSDKVSLKMLCFNPFIGHLNDEWARRYLGSEMGANVKLLPRMASQTMVAKVMASVDCGVFPARAEGWNLELLEMMSMGKSVICTYNTGHTEFATDVNARLINGTENEIAQDGVWFHGQGSWAKFGEAQQDQLIVHLRKVHRQKQTGRLCRNDVGIETAKFFSWQNTAERIIEGLA